MRNLFHYLRRAFERRGLVVRGPQFILNGSVREILLSMIPAFARAFLFRCGFVKPYIHPQILAVAPADAKALVVYKEPDSTLAMACWRLADGSLIPIHRQPHALNIWTPPEGWTLESDMAIEDRQRNADGSQSHAGGKA